jgi:peptidyl-prolyl cis-trans isomerase SurA
MAFLDLRAAGFYYPGCRMTKFCHKFLVLGMVAGSLMTGRAQNLLDINAVAAIVHDAVITRADVLYFTEPLLEALANQYPDPQTLTQKRIEALQEGLNTLIERKLILRDFQVAGYNLPESVIDEEIKDRVRKRFGDRVQLVQTLKARGRTFESYRREVREQIIEEILRAKHIGTETLISPYKIEAYYTTNQARYQVEDQVKLRMIRLVRTGADDLETVKKRALEVLAKVDSGTPFADMTIYNQGSQSDWGWVNNTTISKGLTDIFFKLKANEHTGVIGRGNESERAYWIYQYDKQGRLTTARKYATREGKEALVEERLLGDPALDAAKLVEPQEFYLLAVDETRGMHVRPLTEIREEIEKTLIVQERARVQKKWIDKLSNKTYVQKF